jgi:hypothetical protein
VRTEDLVAPKDAKQWSVRITFTVESVDATLEEAKQAGGDILE